MSGMQKKTIADYCSDRVKYWAWSFKNEAALKTVLSLSSPEKDKWTDEDKKKVSEFRGKIIDNAIVTGGSIASMLLGEEINDIDIYIKTQEVAKDIAWYYLHSMIQEGNLTASDLVPTIKVIDNDTNGVAVFIKSQGIADEQIDTADYRYFESMEDNAIDEFFKAYKKTVAIKADDKTHKVKFVTSNAITLRNGVQIILRFCGKPEEIHKNYDFVHATNYWSQETGLVYRVDALQALLERRLVYIGSRFPVASLFRLRKFIRRGFSVTAGEITKIAYDVSKLDMDDPKVLHDQLIGVDYAYFFEVLSILRNEKDRAIDRTYLFNIIDQVFQDEEENHSNTPEIQVEGVEELDNID